MASAAGGMDIEEVAAETRRSYYSPSRPECRVDALAVPIGSASA